MHALGTQGANLALRVFALERGQVHHPDREIERPQLGFALDRALLEAVDPLLYADLVHAPDPLDHALDALAPADPGTYERAGLALSRSGRGCLEDLAHDRDGTSQVVSRNPGRLGMLSCDLIVTYSHRQ